MLEPLLERVEEPGRRGATLGPLNNDGGHLHELHGALVVLERLREVQHLPSSHRHLTLEET